MSIKPLIIIFLVTSLGSCTKRYESNVNAPCTDSCTSFSIKVTTGETSSVPVSGADVELSWSAPGIPLGNAGRLIAKGKSTSDGTINFAFKAYDAELKVGQFNIVVTKGGDYLYSEENFFGIHRFDTTVNAQIHLPAKGTLKLVCKNFLPQDSADYFSVVTTYNTFGTIQKSIDFKTPEGKTGTTSFSSDHPAFSRYEIIGNTSADQYIYFSIIRKKAGTRTDTIDSLFISKGNSKTYEVEY